ncbi:MAG: hypothetical protein IPG50_06995 [Myxococcales bacterium]|nr:hypothetical protein [Myxococcales bacterium]
MTGTKVGFAVWIAAMEAIMLVFALISVVKAPGVCECWAPLSRFAPAMKQEICLFDGSVLKGDSGA